MGMDMVVVRLKQQGNQEEKIEKKERKEGRKGRGFVRASGWMRPEERDLGEVKVGGKRGAEG